MCLTLGLGKIYWKLLKNKVVELKMKLWVSYEKSLTRLSMEEPDRKGTRAQLSAKVRSILLMIGLLSFLSLCRLYQMGLLLGSLSVELRILMWACLPTPDLMLALVEHLHHFHLYLKYLYWTLVDKHPHKLATTKQQCLSSSLYFQTQSFLNTSSHPPPTSANFQSQTPYAPPAQPKIQPSLSYPYQGSPMGGSLSFNHYYQHTQFPTAYGSQPMHISPLIYHHIPYILTSFSYQTTHVVNQQ